MKVSTFFAQLRHILSQTWEGISRHKFISGTILVVTTLALFSINAILIVNLVLDTSIALINNQVDLVLEIDDSGDDFKLQSLLSDLRKEPGVIDSRITSADEELAVFDQRYPELAKFIQTEEIDNPLSASLFIQTESPEYHPDIISFLKASEYKNLIDFGLIEDNEILTDRTTELINFTRGIKMTALAIGLLMIAVSIIVIYHVIRLAIFYREREIEIMELVGARLSVIWLPFFLEGIVFGIISAGLSLLLLMIPLRYISSRLFEYLGEVNLSFSAGFIADIFPGEALTVSDFFGIYILRIFLLLALIGVVVGLFSSGMAVWRNSRK